MNFFSMLILLVCIELFQTQGPRFGLKKDSIQVIKTSAEHFNECNNCTDDKSMILMYNQLKEYQNSNLTSCNISYTNLSEWCMQRLKVMLSKKTSVCKIYPVECECLKSCYRMK
ncbi:uncharacterized protein LOC105844672 [Hydra vulgaris]|uniref:uncharacterized protein LOC105844672 n=1 Tax=Hydra vulgaris TaxID=6087 RepID=UPI001F5E8410|nr:uncharacterized protein LOC105844672 [Hydra vulgaris]